MLIGAEVLNAPMRFTSIETPSGNCPDICPLLFEMCQAQSGLSTLSTDLPKGINSQNEFSRTGKTAERRGSLRLRPPDNRRIPTRRKG
jgi:hypothetical protein